MAGRQVAEQENLAHHLVIVSPAVEVKRQGDTVHLILAQDLYKAHALAVRTENDSVAA